MKSRKYIFIGGCKDKQTIEIDEKQDYVEFYDIANKTPLKFIEEHVDCEPIKTIRYTRKRIRFYHPHVGRLIDYIFLYDEIDFNLLIGSEDPFYYKLRMYLLSSCDWKVEQYLTKKNGYT